MIDDDDDKLFDFLFFTFPAYIDLFLLYAVSY